MKKLLILLALALTTTACSDERNSVTDQSKVKSICIDGITYVVIKESRGYQGHGYMSVKLDKDSKVIPCGEGNEHFRWQYTEYVYQNRASQI